MSRVNFFCWEELFNPDHKEGLEKTLIQLAEDYKYNIIDLGYVFVSDEELLELNRAHLNHDYYTDILTFDLSEQSRSVEGECYISHERVRENAEMQKSTMLEELNRVVIHGLLHLVGLDDKSDEQKQEMRKAENKYLSLCCSTWNN